MAKNITVTAIFVADDLPISVAEVNNIGTRTKYSRSFPQKILTFVCNYTA